MKRYEQFPHTADIGIRVYGATMKALFKNAAFAMFDIIADLEGLKPSVTESVALQAQDYEELLIAWLDELLYRFYTKQLIFSDFEIEELDESKIKARAFGRPIAANRNRLKTEIKAATYHNLKIDKASDGYTVEIVLDV